MVTRHSGLQFGIRSLRYYAGCVGARALRGHVQAVSSATPELLQLLTPWPLGPGNSLLFSCAPSPSCHIPLSLEDPIVQWPRTPPFHGGNTGSNPVRVASYLKCFILSCLYRFQLPHFIIFANTFAKASIEIHPFKAL